MTVTVIVDDSDPDISYSDISSGNFALEPDTNSMLLSAAIGNTLHNITEPFTYIFTGTSVGVYTVLTPGSALSVPYPWECLVDGMLTPPVVVQKREIPTILKICSQDGLSTELSHNITLIPIFNPKPQVEIYFDYIEYLPSPANSSKLYPYLGVSADDPSVEHDQDLETLTVIADDGTQASEILGFVSYIFNGSGIVPIGMLNNSAGNVVGNYSIDLQPNSMYNISGLPKVSQQPGNIMFNVSELNPMETHNITIKGPASWGLQSFVIANGTIPANFTTIPTQIPSTASRTKHIIVTVIPVVLLLTLLAVVLTWGWTHYRRRHTRANKHLVHPLDQSPITFLPAMLSGGMGSQIKARRRMSLREDEARMIPSAKLRHQQDSMQEVSQNASEENNLQEGGETTTSDTRINAIHIQEEDSGLRAVEDLDNGRPVVILPPAYTAA